MIRNRKMLGIAVAAMLALSAFVAQVASASPLTTTESAVTGTVFTTGTQEGRIKFNAPSHGGEESCNELDYKGKGAAVSGAINEQTVEQFYPTNTVSGAANCSEFGFSGAHITATGCNFTFTTPTKLAAGEVTWSAEQLHLVCESGKVITKTPTAFGVSVCTQTIAAQTFTGGHTVGTNATINGKMAVKLNTTITGIHYIGTGGACGTAGVTTTDGTLTGIANVQCFSNEARTTQIGCTFS
jgi:hypothetical protein